MSARQSKLSQFMANQQQALATTTTYKQRAGAVPTDKAADAFLNVFVVDTAGNKFRVNVVIPLHKGYNFALDEALIAKQQSITNGTLHQFTLVGEVVLAADKAAPSF